MAMNGKANILLVDDQPQKLLSYEAILAPLGQNLIRAHSGKEALQALLKAHIAVVLLDVVMPDMDGFETATMMRNHPRFRTTPIIFVSAISTSDIERLKGYELGAVDYVAVPVIPEILRAKVGAFVELHHKNVELQSLNRELEQRVAQRTSDLANTLKSLEEHAAKLEREISQRIRLERELRLRAEQLAAADRRKDEFLAMLAHELRNPLATIRGATDVLLLHGTAQPLPKRAQGMIDRQVKHMTRLLDDLLDVSRFTGDKIRIVLQPVDLADVVTQAVEAVRPLIDAKRQQLTLKLPSMPVQLNADPTRLVQVVVNLLDNAAKYTEDAGEIWLTAGHEQMSDDDLIRISVRDTGIGMTPDVLPRVFDVFAQADRTLDRAQGGLGLGLTLVQKLVELHGGTVTAHSAGLGRGSEFVVRLPSLSGVVAARDENNPTSPNQSRPLRVLVVDDNINVAEALGMQLEMLGHEAHLVHTGPATIDAVQALRPDVVLLDLGLPGMNGYEVAEHLRRDGGTNGLTLIAISGYGQEEDLARSKQAGFDRHLVKPASSEALQAALDAAARLACHG
jgi:signal transduction histidine kinase